MPDEKIKFQPKIGGREMTKRSFHILIVSFLLLALMAVVLMIFLAKAKEDFPKNITVSENGVTETLLPMRNLSLMPGESKEYTVNLICDATGSYYIYVDFDEKIDGGMKEFVDVYISANGELIYVGTLFDMLDNDTVVETLGELDEEEPFEITIQYTMPQEIGNEAQGSYADFDVHVKIKKS